MAPQTRSARRGSRIELGVDIGGTFTDVVLVRSSGEVRTAKVLTTPRQPEQAVLEGIRKLLAEAAVPAAQVARLIHATTLATNAIVERKGSRTALVTTAGFRDVLEMRNELRYDLYDLFLDLPAAVVERALRLPVSERVRYDGKILKSPEPAELAAIAALLTAERVESVAVCLLHAYANGENEQRVAAALRAAAPELAVSLSSEVLPEIGEYGRFSTTALNAYVQPIVARYLERLSSALRGDGFSGMFTVMASSGGTLPLATAERFPVRLVESGPAAGVHAASAAGASLGLDRVLSLDIGGTTAKMCVIENGTPTWTTDFEVGRLSRFKRGSGLALKVPSVDLIEIGAGGGSIARVNSLGLIEVGPDSAGSDPGPACYGLGGRSATVTDADLVLGYLNPDNFLGGDMRLDVAAAEQVIAESIGAPLGLDPLAAAHAINAIVNENMANAARVYTAERGVDVRSFTLFAFGGAGPVHACGVAERLGIRSVVVPPAGGVLSAIGCVLAPMTFDLVRGFKCDLAGADFGRANALLDGMAVEGEELLRQAGFIRGVRVQASADMRFAGQRSEVNVPLPGARLTPSGAPALERRFRVVYRRRYGRDVPEVQPEFVNLRVAVHGPRQLRGARLTIGTAASAASTPASSSRRMRFASGRAPTRCPAYDRAALTGGQRITGPAVVEDRDSTAVIPPRWSAVLDRRGYLVLSR
ncbi:MAG TPA: hydantoinase/oxoprolinase family protein [Candidatus Methylomirabilis sp.]|nr:hydantoinase/oxoprolinase family protein [Candidatus Methylomirabilis sp.]